MARVPAAGNGRSRGPRGGDKPATRTGKAAPRASNASTSDTASARADKAPSSTGTPRGPRPGQRAPARGRRGGPGGRGGASGRRIDPARLVAFDVLRAVRERDAYANLLLPDAAARARSDRAGRRAGHRAQLRHAARAGHLRRGDRGLAAPVASIRSTRPCGTCSASARTSCSRPGSARTRRSPRRWTWSERSAGPGAAGLRQRRAAAGGHPRPGGWLDDRHRARPGQPIPSGHLAVRYSHPRWIVDAHQPQRWPRTPAGPGSARPRPRWPRRPGGPRVALCAVPGLARPGGTGGRRGGARALVAVRRLSGVPATRRRSPRSRQGRAARAG